ncbi:Nicotinate dehydrogenase subunit B [Pirellulimonas nuda]|uniref:Nicotinate dehydrogenase subunit B n=1 Tax=Pirellulimonas nuda TaxID=2528009 RepID=A0A518DCW0_9BACT|nr:molybdopterin cofactor-binding domain-containing protein [Pirellulimonas nuda]QDU89300.1 Nicotinate dehydrogenase subunit B [Pirellulimonas nuda]
MSEAPRLPMDTPDREHLEWERYELREPPAYAFAANRREFVQTLGAGLLIAVAAQNASAQRGGRRARRDEPLSARMHIGPDGRVTLFTGKVEVGQGARTQLTQAAAEELRLSVDQIRLVMADTLLCPDDGGTAGSQTTPSTVPRVRSACAAARERLTDLAAARLGADRATVRLEAGLFRAASGGSLSLAQLAAGPGLEDALLDPPTQGVTVRRVDAWTVLGAQVQKVGAADIVTGKHRYPSDIQLPEMLYGKVLRPASYGATLNSIDLAPAQAMAGVRVVRDGGFVGCVAPSSWRAAQAIEAIAATADWTRPPHPPSTELFALLKQTADPDAATRGGDRREWGDPASALAAAATKFQGAYEVAYIQHAPMEPRAAVARWGDDGLTVWTGTQQPWRVHGELRQAFRLPDQSVRVIVPDTGGGFGGKHTGEAALEAARLAQGAAKPVCVRWTREEEFTWAYFRPAGLIELRAGLDPAGRLVSWDFTNYNSGGSALQTPYRVPSGRTRFLSSDSPLRQGSYRALASTANTFARESAMDELAEAAGVDPLDFRLAHLEPGRLRDVLVGAAERFGWRERRAEGRSVGIACGTEKGSYVAACVEAEVAGGRIRVLRVCQAYDCGAVQNPLNLRSQIEGCLVMGMGGALTEEIRFADGRVSNASFYDYLVPRMEDLPEIEIVLVDRPDQPSVGAGETPIIAVAPAIAGALYTARGKRCRSLPLRV